MPFLICLKEPLKTSIMKETPNTVDRRGHKSLHSTLTTFPSPLLYPAMIRIRQGCEVGGGGLQVRLGQHLCVFALCCRLLSASATLQYVAVFNSIQVILLALIYRVHRFVLYSIYSTTEEDKWNNTLPIWTPDELISAAAWRISVPLGCCWGPGACRHSAGRPLNQG